MFIVMIMIEMYMMNYASHSNDLFILNMNQLDKRNTQKLSEYEKAQIELMRGKAEFVQGCGGCLMLPAILVMIFCVLLLISMIVAPFL